MAGPQPPDLRPQARQYAPGDSVRHRGEHGPRNRMTVLRVMPDGRVRLIRCDGKKFTAYQKLIERAR